MKLTAKQWSMFPRIQRKYPVSTKFLKSNITNIKKFVWNALCPRAVIKRVLKRKRHNQRVVIDYYHLQRVQWDLAHRKLIKQRKRSIQQWSKRMVSYLRNKYGVQEYVEDAEKCTLPPEEVSKQLKKQLELLKSGKRTMPLIMFEATGDGNQAATTGVVDPLECTLKITDLNKSAAKLVKKQQKQLEDAAPDSNVVFESSQVVHSNCKTAKIDCELLPASTICNLTDFKMIPVDQQNAVEKIKGVRSNFLDMLMSKVGKVSNINNEPDVTLCAGELHEEMLTTAPNFVRDFSHEQEHMTDSSDEFLGFEETERVPGMMMTPLVPQRANAAFVSESLNAYMRENALETTNHESATVEGTEMGAHKFREANYDGLVTPACTLPHLDMPAVPENLQKLRTVAERRHYLQKFSKNHKMAIINNEATIYRELQRKLRLHKSKSVSQQLLQASNSQMPFTRDGWLAASFVTTEYNKYYYQMLDVDNGREYVKLRGVRGNNEERSKRAYVSFAPPALTQQKQRVQPCDSPHCFDRLASRDFKAIRALGSKAKLNREFLPTSLFRPCPLSHKPFQKPLDDETAALLLAGGSMAVVRMPVVELQVFPELGKPLHEIAKRYLQYILPHHDISREWAEFSVSTLQQPHPMKEAEVAAANVMEGRRRKSFTFAIPYLNDRSHILVRRVVDRSEQLDQSFTQMSTTASPVTDLTFRTNLNEQDELLMECADVVSDMINCVTISCSENSFIKQDPDSIYGDKEVEMRDSKVQATALKPTTIKETVIQIEDKNASISQALQHKKQHRLLLELKRLNATIIDAGVKAEKEAKPCGKEYCALGCVCNSLVDDVPLRQHCGKSKCVIECTCKGSSQSRIMRLETDGRSITTEDAFMLRRRATARLARMEKEFTSTIVLTENETLLINESQYDKKRRCTKAPKRYEDFADTDEDFARTSPVKNPSSSSAVLSIEASDSLASNMGFAETATELREPVYVKDTVLRQLKHCNVSLVRFRDTRNMVAWCMVHELYKCFCGGRATEGKPVHIEKDETNAAAILNRNGTGTEEYVLAPTKARYSFEKVEDYTHTETSSSVPAVAEESDDEQETQERMEEEDQDSVEREYISPLHAHEDDTVYIADESESSSDDEFGNTSAAMRKKRQKSLKRENKQKRDNRGRPSEEVIIQSYYAAWPDSSRRVVPLPRKCYLRMNRKRKSIVLVDIERSENAKTRLLLNEHILRSVYYHKHELEKQRRQEYGRQAASEWQQRKKVCEENSKQRQLDAAKRNAVEKVNVTKQTTPASVEKVVDLRDEDSRPSSSNSTTSSMYFQRKQRLKRMASTSKSSFGQLTADRCTVASELTAQQDVKLKNSEPKRVKLTQNVPKTTTAFVDLTENANDAASLPRAEHIESISAALPSTSTEGPPRLRMSSRCSVHANNQYSESQSSKACSATASTASSPATSGRSRISAVESTSSIQQPTAADLGLSEVTISSDSFKEFYNGVIKNMNNLVSKKMQDIDMALKRESKVIPAPNEEILCIIKWSNFLDAFVEGYVFIWEVKMQAHSFLAATIANMMPMVLGALGVINIAALDVSKLPLMARMLRNTVRTERTQRLAIVMQGRMSYWLIRGFLRPDSASACAKPTPQTHPMLTKKINMLCSLLVKQRIKDFKRKQHSHTAKLLQNRPITARPMAVGVDKKDPVTPDLASNIAASEMRSSTPPSPNTQEQELVSPLPAESCEQPFKLQSPAVLKHLLSHTPQMTLKPKIPDPGTTAISTPTSTSTPVPPIDTHTLSSSSLAHTHTRSSSNAQLLRNLSNQERYANMKTNIEFRKVNTEDIDEIHPPEFHSEDHRWLVLDLCNDFSHIFVPDFRDLVSLDRIHKVMAFSRQKQKIVKLQFFQNAPFDAFVTPSSSRKIYFGPLKLNMRPPLLILLQSVDGQMMLREVYQQEHNILSKVEERTTAFWILQINGQIHFEIDSEPQFSEQQGMSDNDIAVVSAEEASQQPQVSVDESDEDDCMIIEECTAGERRSLEEIGHLEPILDVDRQESTAAVDGGGSVEGNVGRGAAAEEEEGRGAAAVLESVGVVTTVKKAEAVAEEAAAAQQQSTSLFDSDILPVPSIEFATSELEVLAQVYGPAVAAAAEAAQINTSFVEGKPVPTLIAGPPQMSANGAQAEIAEMPRLNFSIQAQDESKQLEVTTISNSTKADDAVSPSSTKTNAAQQLPTGPLQSSGCFMPLLYAQQTGIVTGIAAAPKEASYGSTIYISQLPSMGAGVKEVTDVTVARQLSQISSVQQQQVDNTASMICSTAQTQATQVSSPAERVVAPIKRRRISVRGESSGRIARAVPQGPTTRVRAILCEVSGVIKLSAEEEVAKPVAVSTIGATTITKLKEGSASSTAARVNVASPKPTTSCTPEQQAIITPAPIKRRRFSMRWAGAADAETTNLAIDAVLKLCQQSEKGKSVVNVAETADTVALESNLSQQQVATTASTTLPTSSISTIGSTTITKISDASNTQHLATWAPATTQSANYTRAADTAPSVAPQPLVFDVNFMDSVDEPSASIVIKPPMAMEPTTKVAVTNAPSKRLPTTSANATASLYISSGSVSVIGDPNFPVKRTAGSTLKTAATTTVYVNKGSTFTATSQDAQKIVLSAAALNNSKNFRGVTTTSLNFHKTDGKPHPGMATKPQLHQLRPTIANCTSSAATASTTTSGISKLLQLKPQPKLQTNLVSKLLPRQSLPVTRVSASPCVQPKVGKPIINVRAAVPKPHRHTLPSNATIRYKLKRDGNESGSSKTAAPLTTTTATKTNNIRTLTFPSTVSVRPAVVQSQPSSVQQEYGFFCCNVIGAPKFIAKRLKEHFLVKVPSVGTLQIQNIEGVNIYLNRHLSNNKEPKLFGKLPTTWKFLPQERLKLAARKEGGLPIATVATAKNSSPAVVSSNYNVAGKLILDNQRKLQTRKIIVHNQKVTGTKTNVPSTTAAIATTTPNMLNSFTLAASKGASATGLNSVHGDTILIED